MNYLCNECGELFINPITTEDGYEMCPFCKGEDIQEIDYEEYLKDIAIDRKIEERRGK